MQFLMFVLSLILGVATAEADRAKKPPFPPDNAAQTETGVIFDSQGHGGGR